jgi:hypothetical protein
MISKYTDFILEKEFNYIFNDFLLESRKWLDDRTYEWNISNKSKLKSFLSKLPKDKVKMYFNKFLANKTRKRK